MEIDEEAIQRERVRRRERRAEELAEREVATAERRMVRSFHLEAAMGAVTSLAVFLLCAAAWVQHIVTSSETGETWYLIWGSVVFPAGVFHGMSIWWAAITPAG